MPEPVILSEVFIESWPPLKWHAPNPFQLPMDAESLKLDQAMGMHGDLLLKAHDDDGEYTTQLVFKAEFQYLLDRVLKVLNENVGHALGDLSEERLM